MSKAVRILIAMMAMAAFSASPAAAQSSAPACSDTGPTGAQYPPRCPAPQTDKSQVQAGGTVRVTGQCPAPSATVRFVLRPGDTALATATTSATGTYDVTVTIPSSTPSGNYQIVVICSTGPERTANIQVLGESVTRETTTTTSTTSTTAAPATTTTQAAVGAAALPRTGQEILTLAAGGAVLVGLGVAAVVATRRRRQHTA
ncbi:MAG TPA: LPXTG cell wall anchor domain-containing protein [Acidimicrobiales bacterium]|nr:LPXTG cell wall anchor domain-containing protein [Acidimicrobiales bacterium]